MVDARMICSAGGSVPALANGNELGISLGRELGKELGTSLGKSLNLTTLGEGVGTRTASWLVTGVLTNTGEAAGLGSGISGGNVRPKQHALNTPVKSGQQRPASPLHAERSEHDRPPKAVAFVGSS
jgi:hypothetical protein